MTSPLAQGPIPILILVSFTISACEKLKPSSFNNSERLETASTFAYLLKLQLPSYSQALIEVFDNTRLGSAN